MTDKNQGIPKTERVPGKGESMHGAGSEHRGEPLVESRLMLLSAQDDMALNRRVEQAVAAVCESPHDQADIAYTLAVGRKAFGRRAALVLPPSDTLHTLRGARAEVLEPMLSRGVAKPERAAVAFLFPGQGAQFVGMGRQLYAQSPRYREIFDGCDRLLRPRLGVSLRDLLLAEPNRSSGELAEQLSQTAIAQPALFVVEYALAETLRGYGVEPQLLVGHSIGEYAAACLAGIFELEAALELVAERGRLMQSMPSGAMLAVRAQPESISEWLGDEVDLAAENAPGLSVVSGPHGAIAALEQRAAAQGIETRALHTSHAFHSRMMDPILEPFARVVERSAARAPRTPVLSTVTGQLLTDEEARSTDYWVHQLRRAVRFADAARAACNDPARVFVEVGPGVTLISSVAKISDPAFRPRKLIETLGHPKTDRPAMAAVLSSLGQLWVAQASLDFEALYRAGERKLVRLESYPYSRKRHVVEPPRSIPQAASGVPLPGLVPPVSSGEPSAEQRPEQVARAQVLQLLGSRLGRPLATDDEDSSLLELGFDSLSLSQLAGKLRQQFGVVVPVAQLFDRLGSPSRLSAHLAKEPKFVCKLTEASKAPQPADTASSGSSGAPVQVSSNDAARKLELRLANIEKLLAQLLQSRGTLSGAGAVEGRELSASQREIWLSTHIGGQSANRAYNECRQFRFEGELNVEALQWSVRQLVARHGSLRQTFSAQGDRCITHAGVGVVVRRCDLSAIVDDSVREQKKLELLDQEVRAPFDLERGPLLRGVLIQLGPCRSMLVLCAHHVAVDGSSWEIVIRELSQLYSARVAGHEPQLSKAETMDAYLELEREREASGQAEEDRAYWLEHLQGQTEDLELPVDKPRALQRTFHSARLDHALNSENMDAVRLSAKRWGCTAQTVLLAAFQALLLRLTRQQDFICGVPTSGQAAVGLEPLVGHFVHVLPLRFEMDGLRPVVEHVRDVHGVMLAGLDHQLVTFSELLPRLSRPRDPSRPALVQVAFGMGRSQKRPQFGGLKTELSVVPRVGEAFELYVYATEDAGGLDISWSYNSDLFAEETIQLWQRCFTTLLQDMVHCPEQKAVGQLQLVAVEDRAKLLHWSEGSRAQVESHVPVHRAIGQVAVDRGAAVAVVDLAGAHTYRTLDQRANRIAHALLAEAVPRNGLVAVCLDRTVDLVATLLGVWRAGLGYVPLDPAYPSVRVAAIVEDSQAAVVVTTTALSGIVPASSKILCLDEAQQRIAAQPSTPPAIDSRPDDTAYVIFTSGSTGRPKGVQISHRAFENFLNAMRREPGFLPSDCVLALTTISFDISGLELFLPLICGGQVVIASREQSIDPRSLQQLVVRHGVSVLQATPATWQMFFDSAWPGDRKLKVLCGGEAFPRHLADKLLETCGEVWNVYGPTETTVWSTAKRIVDASDLAIGRPIDNTTLYILDEQRSLVPRGVHGELWIGGAGVALGYLGRPDLTLERFVDSPFRVGERIYRTGDLARLREDGQFECLGRVDFQVKIRGYRIELGEVETAIVQEPRVQACVVVARQDHPGEKILVAYLVVREVESSEDTEPFSLDRLRAQLGERLPAYMVPSAYCVLDALPMTPNQKVDRKALPSPARETSEPVVPRDELEAQVLKMWSEAMGHPGLGLQDNYYAAGGHSLMAIRLIEQLNQHFGTAFHVNELFNHPTVEAFAANLRATLDGEEVRAPVTGGQRVVEPSGPREGSRHTAHRGLFCIQAGDETSPVPLFLIHGDEANGLLLPQLQPGQEVWGYHHQGSDGERIRLRSVEELAAHCHGEWLARHGTRPCVVSGHSFGALVAYQLAALRQRAGLDTPRVVLIDARHPSVLGGRGEPWGPRGLKHRAENLWSLRHEARVCATAEAYLDRGQPVPVDMRTHYILGTYALAANRYHPPQWNERLDIIRSEEWVRLTPHDCWERSARGPLRRVVVQGDHLSIVRTSEGVARVGRKMREILGELGQGQKAAE